MESVAMTKEKSPSAESYQPREGEICYRIIAPHFIAGLVIDPKTHRVFFTAPILAWALGKTDAEVLSYFRRKRYKVQRIDEICQSSANTSSSMPQPDEPTKPTATPPDGSQPSAEPSSPAGLP